MINCLFLYELVLIDNTTKWLYLILFFLILFSRKGNPKPLIEAKTAKIVKMTAILLLLNFSAFGQKTKSLSSDGNTAVFKTNAYLDYLQKDKEVYMSVWRRYEGKREEQIVNTAIPFTTFETTIRFKEKASYVICFGNFDENECEICYSFSHQQNKFLTNADLTEALNNCNLK